MVRTQISASSPTLQSRTRMSTASLQNYTSKAQGCPAISQSPSDVEVVFNREQEAPLDDRFDTKHFHAMFEDPGHQGIDGRVRKRCHIETSRNSQSGLEGACGLKIENSNVATEKDAAGRPSWKNQLRSKRPGTQPKVEGMRLTASTNPSKEKGEGWCRFLLSLHVASMICACRLPRVGCIFPG